MKVELRYPVTYLIIVCCILALFTGLTGCSNDTKTKTRERVEAYSTHPSFINERELDTILARTSSISSANQDSQPEFEQGRVISAVVPHHLVAGHLIAEAMETLSRQQPELLIVVGPNHSNRGGRIITGYNGWQTPSGIMYVDTDIVEILLNEGAAVRDEETLATEHSIGAVVPLIKYYIPKSRIVPLVLHYDVTLQEVDALLNTLNTYTKESNQKDPDIKEKTVIISSVDFSHYLTRSQAQLKDEETLIHMQNFDYATLFTLGNDYLDSPASLAAAFRQAERQSIKEFTILDNTNSGIIMQNDYMETTSYFTLFFREE